MSRVDSLAALEVGDGATDFKNAIVRAGGEAEASHRALEHSFAGRVDVAVGANHARSHGGVREDLFVFESTQLTLACFDYTIANYGGAISFRRIIACELTKLHGRDVDMNVDSIE